MLKGQPGRAAVQITGFPKSTPLIPVQATWPNSAYCQFKIQCRLAIFPRSDCQPWPARRPCSHRPCMQTSRPQLLKCHTPLPIASFEVGATGRQPKPITESLCWASSKVGAVQTSGAPAWHNASKMASEKARNRGVYDDYGGWRGKNASTAPLDQSASSPTPAGGIDRQPTGCH